MASPLFPRLLLVATTSAAAVVSAGAPVLAAPPPSQTTTPTISGGPREGSSVAATTATFKFTSKGSGGGTTYACSLDAATAAACTSPVTYSSLAQGQHTFTVIATASGKTASAPATRHWTVDTVAPAPKIAAPSGLTSPVVVVFGELVKSATKNPAATLALTDGGAAVATHNSCYSGSKLVSCASGAYDAIRLTPSPRLVSGQHYTAAVAAGAVKDLAGNANTAASKAFRGATSLQENAPGLTTTWQNVKTSAAVGGSYAREHLRGATASWTFTGTAVTWTTVTGPDQAKADVYVDGIRKATVNNYAAKRHYKVARTISGLTNASHRLRIVVLGIKVNKAAKNTFVSIDAFTVGSTVTSSPALARTWRRVTSSHYSGSHALVADVHSEELRFSFRGTGITLVTQRGPAQGKVQAWVDGKLKGTFDNYAKSASYGVKRTVSGLGDVVHAVRLIVLGQHHKGAKGNLVTIDRFNVA